jgi:DNA ligase, NAD-dependent
MKNKLDEQMSSKILRMKELIPILNEAGKAYYQEDRELMSNLEYDKLYDELCLLEKETNTILAGSPTVSVGYEAVNELPKETHQIPMLSLDKTKEISTLKEFVGAQKSLVSWKLDGLTIVLTYENGKLEKAVTRGNGEVGEVITNNAQVFKNIPLSIAHKESVILRGEAIISYKDFEKINEEIEDIEAKYKNPRNLCSGSVRQLNNEVTAKRHVRFYAFSLVKAEGVEFQDSRQKQMEWMESQGFDVVDYKIVTEENLETVIEEFSHTVMNHDTPTDGLVIIYDDIAYGTSLGNTSKFPRDAMAFKWADEVKETHLLEIEWSPSRTGLINPVAIFEPVELEGTTVSRASVHNLSIMRALELGTGDSITVYKANMIIPQIAENFTRSGTITVPEKCPVCGENTQIKALKDIETLYCINKDCQAKKIKSFTLFVSRNALNIDGLSEATLEKFITKGYIKDFTDIFKIENHKEAIILMEGFGEKSYQNLIASIEKARDTILYRVIYGLGIANIGLANAKMICRELEYNIEKMCQSEVEELSAIDGVGEKIAENFVQYFSNEENKQQLESLLKELRLEVPEIKKEQLFLKNINFVITGSINHFSNREEMKALIESKGGKVTGGVTSKTNYLINNDVLSNSSKNKKAKELNIPIISEEDFLQLLKAENS